MANEDNGKRKRIAILGVSSLLLVAMVVAVTVGVGNMKETGKSSSRSEVNVSIRNIKSICQTTDYQETCVSSLSAAAHNETNPKELVRIGFEVAIQHIREAIGNSSLFTELEKNPKTEAPLKDCVELANLAIRDLQRSFDKLGDFDVMNFQQFLTDMKTWLSGSITYQETCLDGFENIDDEAGEKMRKALNISMQLTTNGLAMVSEISKALSSLNVSTLNRRRLLATDDQLPVMGHDIADFWGFDRRRLLSELPVEGHDNDEEDVWGFKNRRLLSELPVVGHDDDDDWASNSRRRRLLSELPVEGHDDEEDIWGSNSRRRLLSDDEVMGHEDEFPVWAQEGGRRRLVEARIDEIKPNLTVAKDGSGNFTTITEALKVIPANSKKTFVLYIKEGVYHEKVHFFSNLTHLMVIGDGPTKTKITGSLNWVDGTPTYQTATVAVTGDYFIAKDIGFENSAGAAKHQAVALRVGSDQSIFYNCQIDGYQDTLYAHTYRQFYRDCVITGTIDFIFGDSSAMFQNCSLVVRKPLDNQQCIVTAQGRKNPREPTGLVFQNCSVVSDPEYYPLRHKLKSYLARPWKEYSRTIFMESFIDDLIQPEGFLPWGGDFGLATSYYVEYNNRGPGSNKEHRVQWRGIKRSGSGKIKRFIASSFINGDSWVLPTKVPYYSGLLYPPPADDIDDALLPDDQFYAPAPAPTVAQAPLAPPPHQTIAEAPLQFASSPLEAPLEAPTQAYVSPSDAPSFSYAPDSDSPSVAPVFSDAPDSDSPSVAPAVSDAPDSDSPSVAPVFSDEADTDSPSAAPSFSDAPEIDFPIAVDAPDSDSPSAADAPDSDSPSAADAPDSDAPTAPKTSLPNLAAAASLVKDIPADTAASLINSIPSGTAESLINSIPSGTAESIVNDINSGAAESLVNSIPSGDISSIFKSFLG